MKIKVFTAGGTIDKIYGEDKGTLNFSFGPSAIGEISEEKIKLNLDYSIERLLEKDSLEMNDEDNLTEQGINDIKQGLDDITAGRTKGIGKVANDLGIKLKD